jgi:D-tyrosyl-tRNA(Tyr) deacylase
MRACIQRVAEASVTVDGRTVGEISRGLAVLLGVGHDDTHSDAEYLAKKTVELRIFNDQAGKMNRSLQDVEGEMLIVSQFTLMGDCRKGRRPSFVDAAEPQRARDLYERFVERVESIGVRTATGEFQAMMQVAIVNDGPVTILLDSRKLF